LLDQLRVWPAKTNSPARSSRPSPSLTTPRVHRHTDATTPRMSQKSFLLVCVPTRVNAETRHELVEEIRESLWQSPFDCWVWCHIGGFVLTWSGWRSLIFVLCCQQSGAGGKWCFRSSDGLCSWKEARDFASSIDIDFSSSWHNNICFPSNAYKQPADPIH